MARPKKATVDYFPHVCNHGQTMFIIEQRYGNDGYAFWFKLLELLGTTEGHTLDCRNEATWQFLQAKTRLSEETCIEILDTLARLDAIDGELWAQRIVWSQNFVDGVADAYRNRRVETPAKPSFYSQKPAAGVVSTGDNPQSILKETILKETTLLRGNKPDLRAAAVSAYWQDNGFGVVGPLLLSDVDTYGDDHGMETGLILYAIELAAGGTLEQRKWSYVRGILERFRKSGWKRRAEAEAHDRRRRDSGTPLEKAVIPPAPMTQALNVMGGDKK